MGPSENYSIVPNLGRLLGDIKNDNILSDAKDSDDQRRLKDLSALGNKSFLVSESHKTQDLSFR